jgi:predicted peptidase
MKIRLRLVLPLLVILVFMQGCSTCKSKSTGQSVITFKGSVHKMVDIDYLLHLPDNYESSSAPVPLLLFLHGAGERGNDVTAVAQHGPPALIAKGEWNQPFIVVSPQCPADAWWTDSLQTDTLEALLDDLEKKYRIDQDRVYVTGLSMGGFGTWRLAAENPERFAAIAPVCGGGDPFHARRLKHLPIWVFHGAKDDVVPILASEVMVDALKKAGNEIKFTVYPETGHDSWVDAYNTAELYQWLLQQKR